LNDTELKGHMIFIREDREQQHITTTTSNSNSNHTSTLAAVGTTTTTNATTLLTTTPAAPIITTTATTRTCSNSKERWLCHGMIYYRTGCPVCNGKVTGIDFMGRPLEICFDQRSYK
jgi:hypothetical protein